MQEKVDITNEHARGLCKICTGCKQSKAHSDFHLKGLDKSGSPRLQSICKDCANARRVARYQAKKPEKERVFESSLRDDSKTTKSEKKIDIAQFGVEIVFVDDKSSSKMTEVMLDYLEAVYAIPISNAILQTRPQNEERNLLRAG